MEIPSQFCIYGCEEYFRDGWSERGHFHKPSQTMVVVPLPDAYEDPEIEFFAIGRSGCNGIDFGYRKGHSGLWAFYPSDRDFKYMAATVAELAHGWCAGRLSI
jgi:hypothetical protein